MLSESVRNFWDLFVKPLSTRPDGTALPADKGKLLLASLLYDCATQETMELLPFWIEATRVLERPSERMTGYAAAGVRYTLAVAEHLCKEGEGGLLSEELAASLRAAVATVVSEWR